MVDILIIPCSTYDGAGVAIQGEPLAKVILVFLFFGTGLLSMEMWIGVLISFVQSVKRRR